MQKELIICKINKLPKEYQNVLITYEGSVKIRDKYYDHYEKQIVTRRAFYSTSNGYYDNKDNWINTPKGYFHVPQYWENYKGSLMPCGFYHLGRVLPEKVIKWTLKNVESKIFNITR